MPIRRAGSSPAFGTMKIKVHFQKENNCFYCIKPLDKVFYHINGNDRRKTIACIQCYEKYYKGQEFEEYCSKVIDIEQNILVRSN